MPPKFEPAKGARGFQQSNPGVLLLAALRGSLQVFKAAGFMQPLRARSLELTARLEKLLKASKHYVPPSQASQASPNGSFTIITPSDPEQRGAQLSLLFLPEGSGTMQRVFDFLAHHGVIVDERMPDVIRIAPAPLYNTLSDCERAAEVLENALSI